jgi:phosphomannomutase
MVYDTRMHSRQFAAVIAEELAAEGLTVILFDAPRPTPELSFLVRRMGCGAGVVVSASHNPPEDNGIKIYGPDGAQVLGARDAALMRAIVGVRGLPARGSEPPAQIHVIGTEQVEAEADKPYLAHVLAQGVVPGSIERARVQGGVHAAARGRAHERGRGAAGAGADVAFVERQCDPDGGRFSTVASANPELPVSMAMAVELAAANGSAAGAGDRPGRGPPGGVRARADGGTSCSTATASGC